MLGNKVCVFGGTGFVGREVVNALSKAGYEITLVVRRPERYREFALYPNTRLATLTSFDELTELNAVLMGMDVVVNLTADRSTGTELISEDDLIQVSTQLKSAMESTGVKRVMNLSQVNAVADQTNDEWLSQLAAVDQLMASVENADVTILKPSLLVGENDDTTARFVKQLKRMSLLMVANAETVVQPIWVKDFAQALVAAIRDRQLFGRQVEMAGEERMTLKELGELVVELMQKDAIVFPMCRLNAKIMATLGGFAPVASVSQSQLVMLNQDMISADDFSTRFGFMPSGLEWVISTYAAPHHIRERYNYYRKEASRNAEELV